MIEKEEIYSKEYKELKKNPAAFKVWQFFTRLNEMGREMGYLDQKGLSFFPLVEATIVDKIAQTKDFAGELKDLYKDLYTTKDFKRLIQKQVSLKKLFLNISLEQKEV
jgi:hypothetical protein